MNQPHPGNDDRIGAGARQTADGGARPGADAGSRPDTDGGQARGAGGQALLGPFSLREIVIFAALLILLIASIVPFSVDGGWEINLWNSTTVFFLGIGVLLPLGVGGLLAARRLSPGTSLRFGSLSLDQFASVSAVLALAYFLVQFSATLSAALFVCLIGALGFFAATVLGPHIPGFSADFQGRDEVPAHRVARDAAPLTPRPKAPAAGAQAPGQGMNPAAGPGMNPATGHRGQAAGQAGGPGSGMAAAGTGGFAGSQAAEGPGDASRRPGTQGAGSSNAGGHGAAGRPAAGQTAPAAAGAASGAAAAPGTASAAATRADIVGAGTAGTGGSPAAERAASGTSSDLPEGHIGTPRPADASEDSGQAARAAAGAGAPVGSGPELSHPAGAPAPGAGTARPEVSGGDSSDRQGSEGAVVQGGQEEALPATTAHPVVSKDANPRTESISAVRDENDSVVEAFWFAVGTPRQIVDERTGLPLFMFYPGDWELGLEDRGHEFLVQDKRTGRIGVLRDLSNIERVSGDDN